VGAVLRDGDLQASRERLGGRAGQRERAREAGGEVLLAGGAQRAEVLGEPGAEVVLQLGQDLEILEPLPLLGEEARALRERRPAAQLFAPLRADPLRVSLRAGACEQGGQLLGRDPERRRGADHHAAGRAERVERLVPLPPLVHAREAVLLEQPREIVRRRGRAVAVAPARGELGHDRGAAAAVAPHEPLQLGAALGPQELVDQGQLARGGGRRLGALAGAADHDGRGGPLPATPRTPLRAMLRRRRRRLRRHRLRRGGLGLLAVAALALALGRDVGGRAARDVGEGVRAQRACRRRIGEERAHGEQLVPGERSERGARLRGSGLAPRLRAPAERARDELVVDLGHARTLRCRAPRVKGGARRTLGPGCPPCFTAPMKDAPNRAALPPGSVRPARILLYLLLLAACLVSVFGLPSLEQAVREGRHSPWVLMVAPALLAAFIATFAFYRLRLVREGRYHAGRAFVVLGLMVLALGLVLPGSLDRYRAAGTVRSVDLSRHLVSGDPEARAMAAELARHRDRGDALRYVPRLVELLQDDSAEVRRQAHASLVSLAGVDAGGEGAEAAARWRTYWESQGVRFPVR